MFKPHVKAMAFQNRGSDCCCIEHGPGLFLRRFVTSKEERERLEKYREELKNEITGVEERLKELKNK